MVGFLILGDAMIKSGNSRDRRECREDDDSGRRFPDFITFCIIFFRPALQVSVEAILCSVWVTQRKILSSYHVCAKEKEPVRFDQCCSFR